MFAEILEFFGNADYRSREWRLSDDRGPDVPRAFGNLFVVDQFHGKQPLLMNRRVVENISRGEGTPLRICPTLLLDGSAVTPLHKLVCGRKITDDERKAAETLIAFAVSPGGSVPEFDINCAFYYTENLPRFDETNSDIFREYSRSVLVLQTLDRDFFMSTRGIRVDPERLAEAEDRYGSKDFDYIAAATQDKVHSITRGDYSAEFYAALLKLQLIRNKHGKNVDEGFEEIFWFLAERMNLILARVMLVAMSFFSGDKDLDGMLPYQRTMLPQRVKDRTRASAWDFALLSAPDLGLASSDDEEASWVYLVTGDRRLAEIGRRFEIRSVARLFENGREFLWPFIGYHNPAEVAKLCSNSTTFNRLMKHYFEELLPKRMRAQRKALDLSALIQELEDEVDSNYSRT